MSPGVDAPLWFRRRDRRPADCRQPLFWDKNHFLTGRIQFITPPIFLFDQCFDFLPSNALFLQPQFSRQPQ